MRSTPSGATAELPDWQFLRRLPPDAADAVAVLVGTRRGALARIGAGVACVVVGLAAFVVSVDSWRALRGTFVATVAVVIGVSLVVGPGVSRLVHALVAERRERIRADERAEVAAHLHDSVLQTLALVQRRADEPREVVRLARMQERELRAWLLGGDAPAASASASLGAALEELAAAIETEHGVPVEVVRVRDCGVEGTEPLARSRGEAILNAVRHSGAAFVSVYLEVEPDQATIFVRDRGRGFDPDAVPTDRGGISRLDRGPHDASRWPGRRALDGERGDRGRARAAAHQGRGIVMTPARPRVFLVDDHQLFLAGVRAELGEAVDVVGAASEVDAAIEMIRDRVPDVVLVDVHMPAGGGARVIREIGKTHPDIQFLALSVSDAPEDVIATIRAGARGYVTKTIAPDDLRGRDRARAGRRRRVLAVPRGFRARRVRRRCARRGRSRARPADAARTRGTPPDRAWLRVQGGRARPRDPAKTVETHVSSVLRKLQLSSRHQLALGLRSPPHLTRGTGPEPRRSAQHPRVLRCRRAFWRRSR